MDDPPSVVRQNQKHVQDLKPDRRHSEEVHRHHGLDVILQESPPVLRWRTPPTSDVLAHAGLADIDAEFEQFAMDAARPRADSRGSSSELVANLFRHRWAPGLPVTNFPCPEQLEALAVPANDSFRFDDDQGRSPVDPNLAQPSPEESIGGRQVRPLHRATKDAELVPEREVLQLKGGSRFEGCRRGGGQHVKRAERHTEELM